MKKLNKKKGIHLANILAEVNYLKTKGQINESDNMSIFEYYKNRVIAKLSDLESGQKVIDMVQSGKYDEFIHTNMANGFTIDKTAMSIRDHWYGV